MDAKKKRARDVYKVLFPQEQSGGGRSLSDGVMKGMQRMGLPCDWSMAKATGDLLASLLDEKTKKKKKYNNNNNNNKNMKSRTTPRSNLGVEERDVVTLVEFDEALRGAVSEVESVLSVTTHFSHGEDKRKPFDLRVWLGQGTHRLKTAEAVAQVYLDSSSKSSGVGKLKTKKGMKEDEELVLLLELAELPCDPLTFASMRVVLRHVQSVKRVKAPSGSAAASIAAALSTSVTGLAEELNEATELVYGTYLGVGMDAVLAQLNKKIAGLTRSLRDEREGKLETDLENARMRKDLSLCKVKLSDAVAQNAEYSALLKLVRLRKNIERKRKNASEGGEVQGNVYDVDIEKSLIINNKAKRDLAKARSEAEWWKAVNKVSAVRYRALYNTSDQYRTAYLGQKYRLKWRKGQRRLWRMAATASWLQHEFNELSSVVERHIKRKLDLQLNLNSIKLPEPEPEAVAEKESLSFHVPTPSPLPKTHVGTSPMPIPEQTPRNQNQKRAQRDLFVHSYDQLQSLDGNLVEVTPQSMLAAKKKANLNIAALQSLEDEDDSRKIKELGGQIDKLGEEMEYERAVSSKVADDKDGIVLALRRRIAALEDTIVRESTSTYSSQVNSIRQQPYYTNMRSGRTNGSTASGWLRKYGSKGSNPYVTPKPAQSSNDIYERMRIFEERLTTTSPIKAKNLDDDFRVSQSIANSSYRMHYDSSNISRMPSHFNSQRPPQSKHLAYGTSDALPLHSTRPRSNSAFYQAEIYDLTKALTEANMLIAKKSNTIDRLNTTVQSREEELGHVKHFIGKAHANEASMINRIKELKVESRSAREENTQMKQVLNFRNAYNELQQMN